MNIKKNTSKDLEVELNEEWTLCNERKCVVPPPTQSRSLQPPSFLSLRAATLVPLMSQQLHLDKYQYVLQMLNYIHVYTETEHTNINIEQLRLRRLGPRYRQLRLRFFPAAPAPAPAAPAPVFHWRLRPQYRSSGSGSFLALAPVLCHSHRFLGSSFFLGFLLASSRSWLSDRGVTRISRQISSSMCACGDAQCMPGMVRTRIGILSATRIEER